MKSVKINVKGWWFFKKETSETPFGMTMPGRSYNAHTYRHGFTGHEKESDLAEGIYTTEYRLYDTRVGRWLSVDPLFEKYVGMSPYQYCHNNPINRVDVDGRFDTEDEVWHFCWDNEVNGRVSQCSDGTYEIYDEFLRATYYHDSEGVLNTDLPEYVVEGKRSEPQPTFIDNVTNAYVSTMGKADDWANEFGSTLGNCLFYTDVYSFYLNLGYAKAIAGNFMAEFGYMKGYGWFLAGTSEVGLGYRCDRGGISLGLKFSKYNGKQSMTFNSYEGEGSSFSGGVGFLDFGLSYSKDGNLENFNIGGQSPTFSASYTRTWTKIKPLK